MVVVSKKGRFVAVVVVASVWLLAKEMWSGGCQSLVAILRWKVGSERRVLIRGMTERPSGTGRAPFWWMFSERFGGE
jgi:hypothetical protein